MTLKRTRQRILEKAKAGRGGMALSDPIQIRGRVGVRDQDIFGHMTNTRYSAFARIALDALMVRSGLADRAERNGVRFHLVSETSQYLRMLRFPKSFLVDLKFQNAEMDRLSFSYEISTGSKLAATGAMIFAALQNGESVDTAFLLGETG